jgi:hypothetical protein
MGIDDLVNFIEKKGSVAKKSAIVPSILEDT